MHIAEIDNLSLNGDSILHKAGTVSKVVLTVLILISMIISKDLYRLTGLISIVLVLFVVGKIPIVQIGHLALYPALFSVFFAVLSAQQGWISGIVVIFKAVGAALTMLLLITTTPYVDVFSVFSLFMPGLIVDIFLMTYRSFFIIADKVHNLMTSIRLKGGYKPWQLLLNFKTIASMLGTLIIQSFEMSERMYRIYELRGYTGRIPIRTDLKPASQTDYWLCLAGMIILTGTVIPWKI
ncbi:MAG: energy-coupling factor transporter transmembrane component T [Eubacteriales bacterium]|nr:energy-coupling factor transporter transmembrane component T [Eubacteriales bacterium]